MKSLKNNTKSVVLLKTWQDGENGYRIYSDGFCENLGICATSGNNGMYRDKFRVSLQPGNRGFTWQALGTVDLEEVL